MTITESGKKDKGIRMNAYIHAADVVRMRKLAAWLTMQGDTHRVSDSQVIRTALRLAKTGPDLLNAFLKVAAADGRRK